MAQCPNCHSEVKAGERFCGNCGTRVEQNAQPAPPPAPAENQPRRPTGKETVILPQITDPGLTPPAPPPAPPAVDATIMAVPPPAATPPPRQYPNDATIIGGQPSLPPIQPTPPPAGGGAYTGAGLPSAPVMPVPQKSGGNVWKIIGIIAGLGVLACVALGIGGYMVYQRISSSAGAVFATIGALPSTEPFATPKPSKTTVPRPTAVADTAGPTLFRDNFDDPAQSKFAADEDADEKSQFSDDAFAITVKTPNLTFWKTPRGNYSDVAISVDTILDGPKQSATGLVFRSQDNQNFYLFRIAGDSSYALDLYKDDKQTTLIDWTDEPAINGPGESNKLRIETVGDIIRLFVNDKLLSEISDNSFASGKIGIAVTAFDEPNVTVKFDNLVVQAVK